MNHKVNEVQKLYDDAKVLYERGVAGDGSASADSILSSLNSGIENLKANWKGADAGKRIQEVIVVYNQMVSVRNALSELAVQSTKVASQYRDIQIANGASLEALTVLSYEPKSTLSEYTDNADTIDINDAVNQGKSNIDTAVANLETFKSNVQTKYDEIMNNWTAGAGRDSATAAFDSFVSNVGSYSQILSSVSGNITQALANYNAN